MDRQIARTEYFAWILASYCILRSIELSFGQEYRNVALDLHNSYRDIHQVEPLSFDNSLNNRAAQCAQYYAARGVIDHSCPHKNGAGENLWSSTSFGSASSMSDTEVARRSTLMWYAEESQHNYNGDWQPATGHFTQLVWRNSRNLGFGLGRSGRTIVACALYSPHGNVIGQFRANVPPPRGPTSNSILNETTVEDNNASSTSTIGEPLFLNRVTSALSSTLTNILGI